MVDRHTEEHRPRRTLPALRYELSWRTLMSAAVVVGAVWLLVRLWPILVVFTVALILVGTLTPAVHLLERRRMKRRWAVTLVFASLGAVLILLGLLIFPPLWRQLLQFVEDAPTLQARLATALTHYHLTAPLADAVLHFRPEGLFQGHAMNAVAYSKVVAEMVGYATTSVVLGLYLVADRDRARGALFAVVPRSHHVRLARILLNLETIVGGYMRGQLITSLAIGVFVFALLSICRIRGAVALAVIAAVTDVIPFIGGFLATVPAVLAALSRNFGMAIVVLVALVLYQEFESRVLVPRIYGRALRLPSSAVIVALLVGGRLLGIVGALLALPVAAGLRMIIEELRIAMPGDASDDTALRERDEQAEQEYAHRTNGAAPDEAAVVAQQIAVGILESDSVPSREGALTPITGGRTDHH